MKMSLLYLQDIANARNMYATQISDEKRCMIAEDD